MQSPVIAPLALERGRCPCGTTGTLAGSAAAPKPFQVGGERITLDKRPPKVESTDAGRRALAQPASERPLEMLGRGNNMQTATALKLALGVAVVAIVAMSGGRSYAQTQNVLADPANSAPNPYKFDYGWAKLPDRRKWGGTPSVDIDRDGKSIWVFDRCEDARECTNSKLDPIMKFDENGKLVKSFGSGMIIGSHGLHVDHDNNIWVSDFLGKNGKGHTVMKFNQDGKLLMTLGQPGVPGNDHDHFNAPSDILVAPDGSVFVADGHGGDTNTRVVKFTSDGKYIKEWGKKGKGPGEFDAPHSLAMDSAGRLFVADRGNNRIQIFDQEGKYLTEWKQFGSPSGLFIDKKDILYVADNSPDERNPPFKSGIRIGSAKDGKVTAFIPESVEVNGVEGTAADDAGNVYGAYTNTLNFRRWSPKKTTASR
jgi:NHL repeat